MSKRLLITSTDLMMVQFLIPHVIYLSENGFEVEIACSDVGGRMDEIREKLKGVVKDIHIVRLVRSPASPTNFKGYGDMKKVINRGNYDVIWTNEPVMGVVTRLAARKARKNGTKVIYMVHGLLLNVLMPNTKPEFPSISGYGLIAGNFVITIVLCAVVISVISQSSILKKLLGMK